MVIFFWFVLKISLEIASQVLSTLIHSLSDETSSSFGGFMCSLVLVGVLVMNKRSVLVRLYRIVSVFKFVNSFVNLNISYSLILILGTSVLRIWHSRLRVTIGAGLSHSLEHVVLSVGLSCRRLPWDISHLEVPTWLGAITSSSESFFCNISVRGLIWILGCRDSLLNLVTEFLVNDHRVMKTHVALLHTFAVNLETRNDSLRLVTDILLVVARLASTATHITHARCTVDNTWLRNSVTLAVCQDLSFLHILWILISR